MDISQEWEEIYGIKFMQQVGIQEGDIVIDFGCNIGRYSVVIAQIVGETGRVYAIDNDKSELTRLKKRISNTPQASIIQTMHVDKIPDSIEEETVDFVLLYDILHYIEHDERVQIYRDLHPLLKSVTGTLSIHPKHTSDDDFPYWNLKDMTIKDVVMEVENYGFFYDSKITGLLWHNDSVIESSIYNFLKRTE